MPHQKFWFLTERCSHTKTFINTPGPLLKEWLTTSDHILTDRIWHSSILDVRSFRGADCDTYHYLVVAKVRERLAVNKQAAQKSDVERFHLRKLSEPEVTKQNQIKISNRFAALENVNDLTGLGKTLKRIQTSGKEILGLYELKQHKPWFDEECLGFVEQRKQAKMQGLQDPNQSNVDNLNNVRRKASRHFKNNKEHLQAKIDELETNGKTSISETNMVESMTKKGYHPRYSNG